jgi:hypothetical protein
LVEMDQNMHRINRRSVRIDILALPALVGSKQGAEASALGALQFLLT